MDGKEIPKFTSFRPKPRSPEPIRARVRPRSRSRSPVRESSHKRHRHRDDTDRESSHIRHRDRDSAEHESSHRRHRDRGRADRERHGDRSDRRSDRDHRRRSPHKKEPSRHARHQSRDRERRPSPRREDYRNEPSAAYKVDTKGDKEILFYGYSTHGSNPDYRRYGSGRVLGLPLNMRIDRSLSTDKKIYLQLDHARPAQRPFGKKPGSMYNSVPALVKGQPNDQAEEDLDFIPIGRPRKRRRSGVPSGYAEHGILGTLRMTSESEEEDTSELESATEDTTPVVSAASRKNALLTKRTRDHPGELQAWLDLVDHQEDMILQDRSDLAQELSIADQANLGKIRVSIYKEALRHFGTNQQGQIQLHLGLMSEGSKFWDTAKLSTKWQELLAKYRESPDIRIKYLDFVQTNFLVYSYDSCLDAFRETLNALFAHGCTDTTTYLYLMLRLTVMMREAGYQELATAIWQALVEFHLFRPEQGTIQQFEEFWESERPRIGELGAHGWRNFDWAQAECKPRPKHDLSDDDHRYCPLFPRFHAREKIHMEVLQHPGRVADQLGEDDPDHTVLFSEVEEWLRAVSWRIPDTDIIQAFLCFNGFPSLPQPEARHRAWWSDPFLQANVVLRASSEAFATTNVSLTLPKLTKHASVPVNNFQTTLDLLFTKAFPHQATVYRTEIVQNAMLCIAAHLQNDEVAMFACIYSIAMELESLPSEQVLTYSYELQRLMNFTSVAMRFEKRLEFYNAFGLAESRRGDMYSADRFFRKGLSMTPDSDTFVKAAHLQLFASWVWDAVSLGEKKEALRRLMQPHGKASQEDPSGIDILKMRKKLTTAFDKYSAHLDSSGAISAVTLSCLLTLLSYLQRDSLSAALDTHKEFTDRLATQKTMQYSTISELHHQNLARLLESHINTTNTYRPSDVRSALESALVLFPSNTLFLELHMRNEARFKLDDRVRAVWSDTWSGKDGSGGPNGPGKREKNLVDWELELWYEFVRLKHGSGTVNSIRRLFRRACQSDACRHSRGIWLERLNFEIGELRRDSARLEGKEKQQRKGAVREVFFEALRCLPGVKDVMLWGFGEEEGVLGVEDWERLESVGLEKGVRWYVDLEELRAEEEADDGLKE